MNIFIGIRTIIYLWILCRKILEIIREILDVQILKELLKNTYV